jgi:hypothetical protein
MLISDLMLNIQTHAQKLADEFVSDVVSNPMTPHIATVPREDLDRAASHLYASLTDWLAEKQAEALETNFRERASRQRKAGVPLNEIVFAVMLMKKHVWEFVKRNAVVDSIGDLYQRDEAILLISEFFDRLLYATVKGYEEGESPWEMPRLLR